MRSELADSDDGHYYHLKQAPLMVIVIVIVIVIVTAASAPASYKT